MIKRRAFLGGALSAATVAKANRGPALLVRKGNPLGIQGLVDITRKGARIALPNAVEASARAPKASQLRIPGKLSLPSQPVRRLRSPCIPCRNQFPERACAECSTGLSALRRHLSA